MRRLIRACVVRNLHKSLRKVLWLWFSFFFSLHKSLFEEESNKQQTNNTIVTYENQLKVSNSEMQAAQKEIDRLATQLRTVTIEKEQLAEALEVVKNDKEM